MTALDIDAVIHAYIGTLLWSESCHGTSPECDHAGRTGDDLWNCDISLESIGYDIADLAPGVLDAIRAEVTDFVTANAADLADMSPDDIGHNFLLSRNHHGTGFWDRGLGDLGDRLHKASDPYGNTDTYVGDDGQIYVS